MELLAPAGGLEQLRAAITFGADAVYLATERFGMRARACNFALDALPEVVSEAHSRGAKVHVTCNILMSQRDLSELPSFFEAVEQSRADALIISDLGAFSLAGKYAPHVDRHVSTQASVANAEAARMWYDLGAKRVVCAREMSLDDIAAMRANTPSDLEIEAFVHGAMCMAVSGRCLISSYLTGRSANRGHCTQPCRWNYQLNIDEPCEQPSFGQGSLTEAVDSTFSLVEEKRPGVSFPVEEDGGFSFIMNAKDLNMLSHLDDLQAAGVDSIKIEGRNKKAFYVASVVSAYRRVLDGEDSTNVEHELYDLSHRPYGTGFFFGEAPQAPDYDGYEQECLHVADIVGCWPTERGYRVLVRCRNRFEEGEKLEALIPHSPVVSLSVLNLLWHEEKVDSQGGPVKLVESLFVNESFQDGLRVGSDLSHQVFDNAIDQVTSGIVLGDDWGASLGLGNPLPVAVANRSVALYSFETVKAIPAGSYLRKRVFRRSARHL